MSQPRTRWLKGWALKYPPHPHKTKGKISKECRFCFIPVVVELKKKLTYFLLLTSVQGWEFAHRFFERITRFLPKNEQMSDREQIAHIAHQKKVNERFAQFSIKKMFKSYIKHTKNKI